MKTLIAGANVVLPAPEIVLTLDYRLTGGECDISAYVLAAATGKVRGDPDMIFYGQQTAPAVTLATRAGASVLKINTQNIDPDVGKIVICATLDQAKNFSALQSLDFQLESGGQIVANAHENQQTRAETALILAEIYRYQAQWKCRWLMQGFYHYQLKELAEHFGVEIADESAPPPAPPSEIIPPPSASDELPSPPAEIFGIEDIFLPPQITLTPANSAIRLEKPAQDFDIIKVCLDWSQSLPTAVDLDLGAIVQLKTGQSHVVQTLGNVFGTLDAPPFTELQGDDLLFLNGKHWSMIQQVYIYCYIYEGVPNWTETGARVDIVVPDEIPIRVYLEDDQHLRLCCVAALKNDNGALVIERIMKYFPRQRALDEYYGLGFDWQPGRK